MNEILDPVRCAEQGPEPASRVDDEHDGGVIDAVATAVGTSFLEEDSQRLRKLADFLDIARQPEAAVPEIADIPRHCIGSIPLGIDAHEDHPGQRLPPFRGEFPSRLAEHGHRRRADVRAVRKAEEDQVPLPGEHGPVHGRASVVHQREVG